MQTYTATESVLIRDAKENLGMPSSSAMATCNMRLSYVGGGGVCVRKESEHDRRGEERRGVSGACMIPLWSTISHLPRNEIA